MEVSEGEGFLRLSSYLTTWSNDQLSVLENKFRKIEVQYSFVSDDFIGLIYFSVRYETHDGSSGGIGNGNSSSSRSDIVAM